MFGRSPGLEWRYSFSQAELILCKTLPKAAKTAFIGFKAMIKKYVNMRHCSSKKLRVGENPMKIRSYVMKSIMLRYVQENYVEAWNEADNDEAVELIYK